MKRLERKNTRGKEREILYQLHEDILINNTCDDYSLANQHPRKK